MQKKNDSRAGLRFAVLTEIGREKNITREDLLSLFPDEKREAILEVLDELESDETITVDLLLRCRLAASKPTVSSIDIEYLRDSEVCMAELLAQKKADGLTIEEAFNLYIACMKRADGDRFFRAIGTSEAAMRIEPIGDLEEL